MIDDEQGPEGDALDERSRQPAESGASVSPEPPRPAPVSARTFSKAILFGSFVGLISMLIVGAVLPGLVGQILTLAIATVAGAWFAGLGRPLDYFVVGSGVVVLTYAMAIVIALILLRLWWTGY